jgi:hypothetical protein
MLFIQAASKCVWRVLTEASGALGVMISGAATLAEALGRKAGMPNWVWIAIGAALLFITACKIELELMQERESRRKPKPDMPLREAVERIRGKEHVLGDGETIEIVRAFTRIKERALTGEITVFGAHGIQYLPEGGDVDAVLPRLPIPGDSWNNCSLSLLPFMQQPSCGRIENDDSNDRPHGSGYGYIWLDRKQVESIWPLQGRKLTWRNPLKLEKVA